MPAPKSTARRVSRPIAACILSAFLAISPGCYGPFKAHSAVYKWNVGLEGKWTIEVVFAALYLTGVYPILSMVDLLVLNSIEFWNNDEPATSASAEPALDEREKASVALRGPALAGDAPER